DRDHRQIAPSHRTRRPSAVRGGRANRDATQVDSPPDRGGEEADRTRTAKHVRLGERFDAHPPAAGFSDDPETARHELRDEPRHRLHVTGDGPHTEPRPAVGACQIYEKLIRCMYVVSP